MAVHVRFDGLFSKQFVPKHPKFHEFQFFNDLDQRGLINVFAEYTRGHSKTSRARC